MIDPRTTVREWLTNTCWVISQMLRAARLASKDTPSEHTMRGWLDGESMDAKFIVGITIFMQRNPNPGDYPNWERYISKRAHDRAVQEERELIRLRDAVQRERAERAAALQAAERAPRTITQPWFPSQRFLSTSS